MARLLEGVRPAMLSRALAPATGAVWSNGTHTAAPVAVFAHGPRVWTSRFVGLLDHPGVGARLFEALGLSQDDAPKTD